MSLAGGIILRMRGRGEDLCMYVCMYLVDGLESRDRGVGYEITCKLPTSFGCKRILVWKYHLCMYFLPEQNM